MHNFGWGYFESTGDIDAYMLYKEVLNHKLKSETESKESPEGVIEGANNEETEFQET